MDDFRFGEVTNKSLAKAFALFLRKLMTPSRIKAVAEATNDFTDPDFHLHHQARSAEIDEFICSLFLIPDIGKMKSFARDRSNKQAADGFIARTCMLIGLLGSSEGKTDIRDIHPFNYMAVFLIYRQELRQKPLAFLGHQVT
jgi:hypothetical protein